jgi:hypothetical protein
MQLFKINNTLTLHKENGQLVKVDEGNIIKYTARYYNDTSNLQDFTYTPTQFIGIVSNYRFNQDEGYTGIYVRPLYVWNKNESDWNKIINLPRYPPHKYFVYPHLLMLPEFYYCFHPLPFLHTCENVLLKDYTHVVRTMDIEQPYGEGISYNYIAMKTRPDPIREELISKALHPQRIARWLQEDYYDDA